MTPPNGARALWSRIDGELAAGWEAEGDTHSVVDVPLAARSPAGALAWASVAAATAAVRTWLAENEIETSSSLDPHRIAIAYTSDRHLRVNGRSPDIWSPLSGFFRTQDGWVRTHANYSHHATALRRALALPAAADTEAAASAIRHRPTARVVDAVVAAGGLCVPVCEERPDVDAALRQRPILEISRLGSALPRARSPLTAMTPLRGIRVLDLTRVIAGPVATRTLSLLGAEVLRIDPPALPEMAWQHLDTGHGKRSALLDAGTHPADLLRLLDDADVVVVGYRPSSSTTRLLSPAAVATTHPGLVIAQLSAWGFDDDTGKRRGFDSLVQAESGIAWIESIDGTVPGALPAQALDHSAGYLLAAAVITLLRRQSVQGGTWSVRTSLRRVAAELLGMPRTEPPKAPVLDPTGHVRDYRTAAGLITTTRPAVTFSGGPADYPAPRPWGRDAAEWLPRRSGR